MPVYTFRLPNGREVEEFYFTWRDAPHELIVDGEVARRVPSRPALQFPDPAMQAAAARGVVPYEKGMNRDWQRARADREAQQDTIRRESIAETLADFTI